MNSVVIIPARMAATRFPGKPLIDLCGKPMIQWVYERASQAKGVSRVIVATCDREIIDAVTSFGGEAVMTSPDHRSGTDRIAEAARDLDADIIVNVQGDEPLIDPKSIEAALEPFIPCHSERSEEPGRGACHSERSEESRDVVMTSLMAPVDRETARDPNLVKVVVTVDNYALYFSRSPIPYERKLLEGSRIYGHIGLYAYTKDFLLKFASLDPTPLEKAESLEQLRVLEYGYRIKMVEVADRPLGVDTWGDLERVRELIVES